jgi:NADPH:quinone reductase-like Zn-dependent oxidoreductase
MKVNILQTVGQGHFVETVWEKSDITDNEIEVQAVMTGICRSDVDMMQGRFGPLPIGMQGHEGLGVVTRVGKDIKDVRPGSFVATRGEPAYADFYNTQKDCYVPVPELHPRYILEPVACGINVVYQCMREIAERSGAGSKLLIVGSGFLSWVAYHTLELNHLEFEIDVLGSHNQELWGERLLAMTNRQYDVVIDLSGSEPYENIANNGLMILASEKHPAISTTFSQWLWRAVTVMFPSPRTPRFINCMKQAEYWITQESLSVDHFWTQGYCRKTEWQQAFNDAVDRSPHYSRGYLLWNV